MKNVLLLRHMRAILHGTCYNISLLKWNLPSCAVDFGSLTTVANGLTTVVWLPKATLDELGGFVHGWQWCNMSHAILLSCIAIATRSSYDVMSSHLYYVQKPHDRRYTLYLGCQSVWNKEKMAKKTPKIDEKSFLYLDVSSISFIIYECLS